MTLTVGTKYRCKETGVVGTAVEVGEDDEGRKQAKLKLDADHLEDGDPAKGHIPKAHDGRWYNQGRLEEIADGDAVV